MSQQVAQGFRLSPQQRRLWSILDEDGGTPYRAYRVQGSLRIDGELDRAALEASVGDLVARHEILRTVFQRLPGRSWPAQVVLDEEEWRPRLELFDLSGREPAERTAALEDLWEELRARPFALDREPPLAFTLVRLAPREHVLLIAAHALCADAAALEILARDLREAYAARLGLGSPGDEEPAQYADVAEGLNELLETTEETDAARELWREMRAGRAVRELPFEHEPDPAGRTAFQPRVVGAAIDPETLARAEELAGAASCPLSVVLLAAWQVLLHRLTSETSETSEAEPWTLGVDFEGRHYEGFDTALGLFVRTLPLPVAVREEAPFRALLSRLDRQVEALYDGQEYFSWERLPEGERDGFFAAGFGFEEPKEEAASIGGVSFSLERTYACVERFRLKLVGRRHRDGLRAELLFDAGRFAEEDVRRLLDAFRALLANAVAAPTVPDTRAGELDLIGAAEHRRLLAALDARARPFAPVPVHHLIGEQVERTPGAVALSTEDDVRLTYRELADRARRLAAHLRRLGVGPDVRVGLCVERSVEMVVGVLGVLEAGGVYVPVDPEHPAARQAFVLEDSRAAVLLTRPSLLARLPQVEGGTRVVFLDEPEAWSGSGGEVEPPLDPENAAYVLYTSGSTGVPKGVAVRHRALTNHMLWMREAYPLTADDRVLQKTPFGFDASVWELFLPLMTGAELVLAAPGAHREPALLVRTLAARRITVLQVVPSLLRLLLEEETFAGCTALTRVFCGGEPLWGDLRDRFHGALPGALLINLYGPTETTVQISTWVAERGVSGGRELAVPIGVPIHNARVYLLDRRLRPVPDGFLGEVWIGGEPPARGYLDRPGLTAASFLPDPFAVEPGGRMYRSGDLARRRPGQPQGALEFVNRAGQQIKIRGNRFDPGEIEVILRTHPRVAEAVAVVREDQPGDARLVAYVVPRGDRTDTPEAQELRALLAERVPEYMVPTSYVVLTALPLTPNGKLDRAALPAPAEPSRQGADLAAPRTAVEEVLAQIWADLLGLERVGVHDNFFELGGHSLLGTQLIYRVREAIGVELSLRGVFESPTVAGIAEQVEALWRVPQTSPIVPVPRDGEIPLSFAQQRLWFLDRLAPGNPYYNVFSAVRLTGALDERALAASFAEIVRVQEALRTRFPEAGGRPVQVVEPRLHLPLPTADLSRLPAERRLPEAERLALIESRRPFDLAHGPLIRLTLLCLEEGSRVLLASLHHIVSDAWSVAVFYRSLTELYAAFAAGQAARLKEPPVQYADFAVWQRRWLEGETREREVAYWGRQLAGLPVLELLPDRPRPLTQRFRGAALQLRLPAALSAGVEALARSRYASPFMLLLAGFQALLHRYTGQDDVVVGSPVANRQRGEIEGLIGFFVNTLVLRTDLSGDPSFGEVARRVRETALEAYAHQTLPFEMLVETLEPERDLARQPLFQVMFQLQNVPLPEVDLGGVRLEPLEVESGTAPFDLGVDLIDTGDGLALVARYSTDLFDGTTVRRLVEHYGVLLAAAVADPERPVGEIALLGEAETHQLSREWNDTAAELAAEPVHRLFERRAAAASGAVAVVFAGEELSYGELDRRANRLAWHLIALGVRPGSPVALHLDRSVDIAVAMLGVWKAGGAFVPLDPESPRPRLERMLEEVFAGATPIVVDREQIAAALALALERDSRPEVPQGEAGLDSPAYLIFTSGTTGRPKAVLVDHGSLANVLSVSRRDFAWDGRDRMPVLAAYSFDIFLFELWSPLLAGGRAELFALRPVPDVRRLVEALPGMTRLHAVPSLMRGIVEEIRGGEGRIQGLRTVFTGGEAVPADLLSDLLEVFPGAEVRVLYGPTEGTIVCASHEVDGAPAWRPLLGRPLGNTVLELRDRRGNLVPLGVAGEIWIGGAAVSRGYWNRPELTRERFLQEDGGWYRTGDLARYRADGVLEYLGRADEQVKVRGFRIEPGEVEAALREHPAVREAMVVGREDEPGQRRLVAYLTCEPEAAGLEEELPELESEQVERWRTVYNTDVFGRPATELADPAFNISGWNSSVTGEPIPAEAMREWVGSTVARIAALSHGRGPRRVLEIGCGTGLLLFRLAPGCERYVATDFSAAALGYVGDVLARLPEPLNNVSLRQGEAEDFSGLEPEGFEAVVLNSVIQYFPGEEYLLRVLEGAVSRTAPRGIVFVGDVRSLPLLEAFHAWVELERAPTSVSRELIRRRVAAAVEEEPELVVDPALFWSLPSRLPRVRRAEVQLKRGRYLNELTRFRYDVVLHVESPPPAPSPEEWSWEGLEAVRHRLRDEQPEAVVLRGAPNARVEEILERWALLEGHQGDEPTDLPAKGPSHLGGGGLEKGGGQEGGGLRYHEPAGSLDGGRPYLDPPPVPTRPLPEGGRPHPTRGFDPEAFWSLGDELGYAVAVSWSAAGEPGKLDVILRRPSPAGSAPDLSLPGTVLADPGRPLTNRPLRRRQAQRLVPRLRSFLEQRLPDYMVPSALVVLDRLPRTPHGKVDRRALPAPERLRADLEESFVAPRNAEEEILAGIWAQVLGLDRVGARDNFFALGGHSLLATQVVSRIRQLFGVEVKLRSLFQVPTVEGLAGQVREALAHGRAVVPRIERVPRQGPLPLSFGQQRLWFLDRLEPGSAYNMPSAFRLLGDLDETAWERAGGEILRRHEVLRTAYREVAGEPVQVIEPPLPQTLPLPLPRVDLSALPAGARQTEARRLGGEEARRPFDLSRSPVLRTLLLRLAPREHLVLFTLHHIASDGWSMQVLAGELAALYAAFAAGLPSPLPDLPLQYADFAVWQRRWLEGPVLEAQLAYWKEQLAGAPPFLDLPTDRPRRATGGARPGSFRAVRLPAELALGLERLRVREGSTLFGALLTAFQALLSRYCGQTDVSVGTPVAGRRQVETEGLIGFFVNTLVLRTDLGGDPSFRELLGRVRSVSLGALSHQDVPFERLVEELQPERNLAHSPLFQVMFVLQNVPRRAVDLPGLRVLPAELGETSAIFDLNLLLAETGETGETGEAGGGLTGGVEYDTDLFDATTVDRLIGHFRVLLEGAVADPALPLSGLPLLSEAQRHQLLAEWTGESAVPSESCLHHLFQAQARRTPDAVAVIHGEERLSYGELEARAGRLAARLRAAGVGPESRVGISLARSLELPVAILAVLEAGGAYVPIDPAYPEERRRFLLEDSGAAVRLSESGIESGLEGGFTEPAAASPADPGNLAYVIYTSGSTGRPKGVAIQHRSAVALIDWARQAFSREELAGVLASTSVSFDLSIFELFVPLSTGGAVVLAGNLLDLPSLPAAEAVTLVNTVPSALAPLLHWRGLPASVRTVNVAGEPLHRELARQVHAGRPVRLFNLYGPSEDTTYSTGARIAPGDRRPPAIGRPLAGSRVRLLDFSRPPQPVPAGAVGELYLGGDGLARGYLGRPDLTAERFVPDPWGEPGGRLYRTGDLGRFRGDGELEFLGRADRQVKLRGFRIEPGEIESLLEAQPGVREAAVLVERDAAGDPRLVAWIAPASAADPAALRQGLVRQLPAHMIPSLYGGLEALPRTPNGKLDRQALSLLAPPVQAPTGRRRDSLRTQEEELLAAVWSDLLGVEGIGGEDDFFRLGGHSLKATQLVSRLRDTLRVEVPLRTVFEHPTLSGIARELGRLRAESGPAAPPLRKEHGPLAPLSFSQQRLWILDRLRPGSAVYNLPMPLRLSGRLEVPVLAFALREVARRHETLRTSIAVMDGQAYQEVSPLPALGLPLIDLSALPPSRREDEARNLAIDDAVRPFDLEAGPLARAALLVLGRTDGAEEHVLLLDLHHIIADGWSMGVLVRDVAAHYQEGIQAGAEGRPALLPELPIQFADFAIWQREWMAGERLEAEIARWRERLAGAPTVLDLPGDRPRPAVQSFRGGHEVLSIPGGLARSLETGSRSQGATPFMVLLAVFGTLLSRYTGQDDLLVGSPVANRNRIETEGLIGFFVNSLVLRTDLTGGPTFREALRRVRDFALDAFAHQDLPFERLVEALEPDRDLSRNPVFQVMLAVQNAPVHPLSMPGLELRPLEGGAAEVSRFDLTLSLMDGEQGLVAALEYNLDLFEAAMARRLLGHFQNLLAAALADPESPLVALPLLGADEAHQLLAEWGRAGEAVQGPRLDALIEEWAERLPDLPAVVFGDESLTYGELDRRARRLAGTLRDLGAGPETVVGLCLEPGLDLAVAILAIWKAGGAYLPLDPSYPPQRLSLLLEDSRVPLLLTRRHVLDDSQVPPATRVLHLDEERALPAREALPVQERGDLAYVIYTSGSTGRPKGVLLTHSGLANLLAWSRSLGVGPGERVLQFSSIGFDASVHDFATAWSTGATLVLAGRDQRRPGPELIELLRDGQITYAILPPAALGALPEADLPALATVAAAGEACPAGVVARWAPGRRFFNLYGPTELTIQATAAEVRPSPLLFPPSPPIGRPIGGIRTAVLDREMRPVPTGVPGELYLSGAGVARGYHERPGLTAQAFLPDPWGGPGERMYRSGDRVRWRAGGELEFLGRVDQQVKVRGFRIEPGEVEAALRARPEIRDAAVLARDGRLIAFCVPAPTEGTEGTEGTLDSGRLRAALREVLPDHLVPSVWVTLDELPLSPHGKVDRQALARREAAPSLAGAAPHRPPRTPVEKLLAQLWAGVLGVERVGLVGLDDGFFELGGHSLLATQLVSRVRETFGVELPLRVLFEAPTLVEMAARLERTRDLRALDTRDGAEPPLVPLSRPGDIPLSFAQQRLWFLHQLAPDSPFYNMPAAFRFSGPLDEEALRASFRELVRLQESLRTRFPSPAGRPVQVIDPPSAPPMPVIDLAGLPAGLRAGEAARWAEEEARAPFDLAGGPLLRVRLLRLGGEERILLVTLHHIVSDGWSMGVLYRDFTALYGALAAGLPSPLPPLPVQYADFAIWQRRWLESGVREREVAYWERQLAGLPTLEMPTDRPRPAVQSFRGGTVSTAVSGERAGVLWQAAHRLGLTPFMLLLTGFQALLHRYTGQDDLVAGSPVANRQRGEIEGLIGFFVNTLVLRTDLSGEPSFAELGRRVRETALGAYAHQNLPFEMLVEALEPERDLARQPLFQVMFQLLHAAAPVELRGLRVKQADVDSGTAPFDLGLDLIETGDGLAMAARYAADLFDGTTIRRLVEHYIVLLAAAVADPERPVGEIALLGEAETHQLSREWNDTAVEMAAKPVHRLFERRAAEAPGEVAVVFAGDELTYGELDRQANRLAWHLMELGVRPGAPVALFLERSVEIAVAMLGVWKAGGAFVPLDPESPRPRLERMLDEVFAGVESPVVVDRDLLASALAGEREDRLEVEVEPGSAAYLIFTSGTTGRPKAVLVDHGSLANVLSVSRRDFGWDRRDRMPVLAAYSFDIFLFELWNPLLSGGRAELFALRPVPDLRRLAEALPSMTRLHAVPSLMRGIVEEVREIRRRGGQVKGLRTVFVGGEAVPADLLADLLEVFPGAEVRVLYGPTEGTILCASHPVDGSPAWRPPIGRPLGNISLELRDRRGQPVPLGVAGEIWIGGAAVSRGYWNRPELTRERFLQEDGGWYRTGDLARYRADGVLEYLGRADEQVKVRGFRIEPGEVEAALREHPGVRQVVVVGREDEPGQRRLVAYLTCEPEAAGLEEELPELENEQVERWRTVYDTDVFGRSAAELEDPTFNISGWNSSATGEPIPDDPMREWVGSTVARIAAAEPRRVLEIGCGTGLLLFRLAPGRERYVGTDFSATALGYVRDVLARLPEPLPAVSLRQGEAEDFSGLEPEGFDAVVLNSVIQYFPSEEYLLRVLEGAVSRTAPGGIVFVGDVRSLPLLEAFHAWVELERAPASVSQELIRRRVAAAVEEEPELVADPALFWSLPSKLTRVRRVEVQLKRGRHLNELTRFRYDVVLHVGDALPAAEVEEWSWRDLEAVRHRLRDEQPEAMVLRGVPNARLEEILEQWSLLKSDEADGLTNLQAKGPFPLGGGGLEKGEGQDGGGPSYHGPAGSLSGGRPHLDPPPVPTRPLPEGGRPLPPRGADPEAFWALGEELGYAVAVSWSAQGGPGEIDIVLRRPSPDGSAPDLSLPGTVMANPGRPLTNQPLRRRQAQRLVPRLRSFLEQRLPDYMVPSALVVLDRLPRTPHGKLDRRALPAPERLRAELEETFVAPRTAEEEILAGIWAQVLGLDRVGARDNFFALGGHSLLATQVVSRIRQLFGVEVELRSLFEVPTVEGLAGRVRQALAHGAAAVPRIEPVPRQGPLPLSFGQQRLWFLDRLEPGPAYNMPSAFRLLGDLDETAWERAGGEILRRHEVLRTAYRETAGEPVQVIEPPLPQTLTLPMPRVDLSVLPAGPRQAEARRLGAEEASRPFDLGRAPMLRTLLLRLAPREHLVLFTLHHIAGDGWSMDLLAGELAALYAAFAAGRPSPLPDLPIQYADFAVWQRRWLEGPVLEAQLAYWKEHLADAPPSLDLPTDRPRHPMSGARAGSFRAMELPAELAQRLERLRGQEGSTLFGALLAAFQALLSRYCGQTDVSVGTPVAGRRQVETENLIGFFVNTLVLRTELEGDPSFRELLGRVRSVSLGALSHQDLPFERLVEELQPERSLVHTPLFQVMFALQLLPAEPPRLPRLTFAPAETGAASVRFDLELTVMEPARSGEGARPRTGLPVAVDYNADLFDGSTIERLARHFTVLLEGAVADPERRLSELPLLTAAERWQLAEWNRTAAPLPSTPVRELIRQRARQAPGNPAVISGDGVMSYGELDHRASRLAAFLRAEGIGPEAPVGVHLERSPALYVGLLATFEAGGYYLPLDPDLPAERLQRIVASSGVSLVLTQERLADRLPSLPPQVRQVCVDVEWDKIETAGTGSIVDPVHEQSLAYAIYTSGSTGEPKAVGIPHRALTNHDLVTSAHFGLGPDDRVLQFASVGFDLGLEEMLPTWVSGGAVVPRPAGTFPTFEEFDGLLRRYGITVLNLSTGYWHEWVTSMVRSQCLPPPSLRLVVIGTEQALPEVVAAWRRHAQGRVRWMNAYGATETINSTTVYEDVHGHPEHRVPIGSPLPNVQAHVLDASLEPVPVGVVGEICVGGADLARGYLGRPDWTAASFLPDPWAAEPGGRIYRTGDRGRRLPDGSLEHLGRVDVQIKVRGFRVEPGEVEAVLLRHPAVEECAVVAQGEAGSLHLAAFVVPREGEDWAALAAGLRTFTAAALPAYMVPSAFSPLERLPLTSSAKVDRRRLAALTAVAEPRPETGLDGAASAPRDETERRLSEIWRELLGLPSVRREDSFFDLGGHSMLAVRLMSRIRSDFGRDLPISVLFRLPTLEGLAGALREQVVPTPASALVEIQPGEPGGTARPFFFVHPSGGNVFCYAELSRKLGAERPVFGLQAPAADPGGELETVEGMAAHYLREVRQAQPAGPYLLGGWSFGGLVALEMARQLREEVEEVELVALIDPTPPNPPGPAAPEMNEAEMAREFARDLAGLAVEGDAEQLRRYFEPFRRSVRAQRVHVPRPYTGRVALLVSEGPGQLWRPLLSGPVETRAVAADHYSILRSPVVGEVAAWLGDLLED